MTSRNFLLVSFLASTKLHMGRTIVPVDATLIRYLYYPYRSVKGDYNFLTEIDAIHLFG